ncbi:helix-turn-helix transcriptional regulator [Methylobacterium haplocladii]|uniref:Uncharacterized protein n=1 Tax=Methylobacterium haplocladii TaxID=1176176 RepID=A0A512IVW2_9HYPH|nr:hypothetical protein [Methylobacterium haplocladii]GEP01841.1 hypothetical protein MHA02_42280 [Methylobacterium haplocladii]GJD86343.1 hypothetical protein HPGCJGGD_4249 [Methylobacterium haplocladii]GLS61063.1 hypothetical protein GCM10007887_37570 [Methylobacterium haplocladii]
MAHESTVEADADARAEAKAKAKAEARVKANSYLEGLPAEAAKLMVANRVLGAAEAAEICGFSLAHWRRMYRTGKAPKPIKLGGCKLGWRFGTLAEFSLGQAA